MKIISIIPIKNGYSVIMDENQKRYELLNKIIKKEKIEIGEFDEDKFAEIYSKARKDQVIWALSRKLKYKSFTEKQLREYLGQKGFDSEEIDYGINLLKEKRIINDEKLIENSILYYKENHLASRFFIAQKLSFEFGKEYSDFIKEKLEKIYSEDEEIEVAYKLLMKKKFKNKDRALIFVRSKGFTYSSFVQAFSKYLDTINSNLS